MPHQELSVKSSDLGAVTKVCSSGRMPWRPTEIRNEVRKLHDPGTIVGLFMWKYDLQCRLSEFVLH